MKLSVELFDSDGNYAAPRESTFRTIEEDNLEDAKRAKNRCWYEAILAVYNEFVRQGRDYWK